MAVTRFLTTIFLSCTHSHDLRSQADMLESGLRSQSKANHRKESFRLCDLWKIQKPYLHEGPHHLTCRAFRFPWLIPLLIYCPGMTRLKPGDKTRRSK